MCINNLVCHGSDAVIGLGMPNPTGLWGRSSKLDTEDHVHIAHNATKLKVASSRDTCMYSDAGHGISHKRLSLPSPLRWDNIADLSVLLFRSIAPNHYPEALQAVARDWVYNSAAHERQSISASVVSTCTSMRHLVVIYHCSPTLSFCLTAMSSSSGMYGSPSKTHAHFSLTYSGITLFISSNSSKKPSCPSVDCNK